MKGRRKRRDPRAMSARDIVNQLLSNPKTEKDGTILWLMLELNEAIKTLNAIRGALQ
jgi:hypothetical protein